MLTLTPDQSTTLIRLRRNKKYDLLRDTLLANPALYALDHLPHIQLHAFDWPQRPAILKTLSDTRALATLLDQHPHAIHFYECTVLGGNLLHHAAHESLATINLLLDRGIPVNAPTILIVLTTGIHPGGSTAFDSAVINHRLDLAQHLLDRGATLSQPGDHRHSTLHVVAAKGHYDSTAFLLKLGYNPNTPDAQGRTALHHAARRNTGPRTIELLLTHQADPTLKEKEGLTPADLAKKHDRPALAKRLS